MHDGSNMRMSFDFEPKSHLLGSNGPIHTVAYSASPGNYILTGSADRAIRLYNPLPGNTLSEGRSQSKPPITQGRLIQTFSGHGYEVLSLDVASDNERFVSAGGDRSVFLWDVTQAVTIRRFGGNAQSHTARINSVQFAGEGDSLLVSGGFDTSVRIWDTKGGSFKPIQVLDDARDAITSIVVRDAEIIVSSVDGRVRSYDVRTGQCTTDVIGASVTSLSLTKDGRTILVGSLDSKIRLLDREKGTCLKTYSSPAWKNEELRVQSLLGGREKFVMAGDEMTADAEGNGRIWAWDLLTGALVAKMNVSWGPQGFESRKRMVGTDGREKPRSNVISCMAWREDGWGDQFSVGGTSGVVTVFGTS